MKKTFNGQTVLSIPAAPQKNQIQRPWRFPHVPQRFLLQTHSGSLCPDISLHINNLTILSIASASLLDFLALAVLHIPELLQLFMKKYQTVLLYLTVYEFHLSVGKEAL